MSPQCPLCYSPMEVQNTTPCMDCGAISRDTDQRSLEQRTYTRFRIFPQLDPELTLVLCDFCMLDFGAMDPTYFGLPRDTQIGYGTYSFLEELRQPVMGKDHTCPDCGRRAAFLRFVATVRELTQSPK